LHPIAIHLILYDKEIYSIFLFSLKQSLQDNRHKLDAVHYKQTTVQQTIGQRDELINQLLVKSTELNKKVRYKKQNTNTIDSMSI
jgi:hypothetical protein